MVTKNVTETGCARNFFKSLIRPKPDYVSNWLDY